LEDSTEKGIGSSTTVARGKEDSPVIITFWNRAKGRIDEMTRHLDSMLFDLPRGSPKQRLVMREVMKLALSVYFSTKHCFPSKPIPKGQGYSKIQSHLWHLGKEFTLKEVVHKLATTYTVHNQIKGMIPGLPMPGKSANEEDGSDDDAEPSRRGLSSLQSQALAYIRGVQNKCYKFSLFCKDELLERVCSTDARLNHSQVSLSVINSGKKRKPSSAKQSSQKKRKASGKDGEGDEEKEDEKEGEKEGEEKEEEGKKDEEEMETEESNN